VFDSQLAAVGLARTPGERVRAHARLENSACAARLSAMADMLADAYAADGSAEREQWRIDNWAAVCAQIGAAHTVTSGVANGLLTNAVILRERLPKIAALFAAGDLSYRQVHEICSRTALVQDIDALAAIDTELAALFATSGAMSVDATQKAIDATIWTHDPYAVRRSETAARGHHVDVRVDNATGTGYVEASLSVTDLEAFDKCAEALAATVCSRDPRTIDERRSAAMGAMGLRWDRLPCLCQSPDCDADGTPPVGGIIVHVITRPDVIDAAGPGDGGDPTPDPSPAEAEADVGESNPGPAPAATPAASADPSESDYPADEFDSEIDSARASARSNDAPAESDRAPAESDRAPAESSCDRAPMGDLRAQRRALHGGPHPLLPQPWHTYTWSGLSAALTADPGEYCPARPGVILGGPVVPAAVLAQAAMHATITPLIHPGNAPPEPRYRPSTALAEFIRCRDLTCRFPGCTRPATVADVDHTIPYPHGPTQASNLKCLCRQHHLLKTFWPGWSDRQYPDGTLVWTDPDGQTYTTQPGSRLLFPELCDPTAPAVTTGTPPPKDTAGMMMPRRRTTRAHDRARRIADERARNQELIDNPQEPEEPEIPEPLPHPSDDDPPPF